MLYYLLSFFILFSAYASGSKLVDIKFHHNDNQSAIDFIFNENISYPISTSLTKNKDLCISFLSSASSLKKNILHPDIELIKEISLINSKDLKAVIHLTNLVNFNSYINKNIFTLSFDNTIELDVIKNNHLDSNFLEEKISLDAVNVPVVDLLHSLSRIKENNLIISDDIKGKLTLNISNASFENLMETILSLKGLLKQKVGKYFVVFPASDLNKISLNNLSYNANFESTEGSLDSFVTEIVKINYTSSKKIAKLLDMIDLEGSPSRYIAYDEDSNFLVIRAPKSKIKSLKRIIFDLDKPLKQVVIETKIVTLKNNFGRDLGVSWRFKHNSLEVSSNFAAVPEKGTPAKLSSAITSIGGDILDLELSALKAENMVDILASPKIVVANNYSASIEQGVEIPFVVKSESSSSISFKKAALSLTVKPRILSDNSVFLDLEIHQDHRGDTVIVSNNQSVSIDMQRVSSKVLIKNNNTLVIGGIYQKRLIKVLRKVPVLGDMPILKFFFNSNKLIDEKFEVLIFVTPKVV